jgi:hypothetical protein
VSRRDQLPAPEDRFWDTPGSPRRKQPWVSVDCGRCGRRLGRVFPIDSRLAGRWPARDSDELHWADMLSPSGAGRLLRITNPEAFQFTFRAMCPGCGMDARCRLSVFAPAWLAAFEAGPPSVLRINPDGTPG